MESICSGCKKQMIPSVRYLVNNEKVFYKTCDKCRAKRKNLYFLTQKLKDDRIYPPATNTKDMECYICFNEFYKDIKGIECFQCKKSCCAYCYMTMFINTRDSVKCSLCRFQAHTKPYIGQNFSMMVESRAFRCGFKKKSDQYAWSRLVS